MKKILIIAAHPDDEVLGCGGLIAKNIRKKNKIRVIFLAEGITARYSKKEINSPKVLKKSNKRNDNAILALKELGLKKSEIFLSTKPSCRLDDFNQLDIIKIIEQHIKAVTKPFNGAYGFVNNQKVIIYRAHSFDENNFGFSDCKSGEIVAVFPNGKFLIKVNNGLLLVHDYKTTATLKTGDIISKGNEVKKAFKTNENGFHDV